MADIATIAIVNDRKSPVGFRLVFLCFLKVKVKVMQILTVNIPYTVTDMTNIVIATK